MKFRLTEEDRVGNKTGPHMIGEEVYHRGDVIETDQPLDVLFRNKFERVPDDTPVSDPELRPLIPQPSSPAKDTVVEEEKTSTTVSEEEIDDGTSGQDVTSDFPDAALLKYKVYSKEIENSKKLYTVVDFQGEEEIVVKTSKSQKNITKFLEKELG